MKAKLLYRRRKGLFTVVALLSMMSLTTFASLALLIVSDAYSERAAADRRIALENAADAVSRDLEQWLRAHVAKNAAEHQFSPSALPLENPRIQIPTWFLDEHKAKHAGYNFEAAAFELFYDDAFEKEAAQLQLPYLAPFHDEKGRVTRSYRMTVTVTVKEKPRVKYFRTMTMRAFLKENGKAAVYRSSVYDM